MHVSTPYISRKSLKQTAEHAPQRSQNQGLGMFACHIGLYKQVVDFQFQLYKNLLHVSCNTGSHTHLELAANNSSQGHLQTPTRGGWSIQGQRRHPGY